ncbi:MAG: flippase-like domain-containing protein [Paracoccaceae bacterium]|nr:flippase-like domain-containing protein [Paracoccaceae bacterium]
MFGKAGIIRLLRVAVTLAVLALLWRTVDGPGALDLLLGADPVWLLAAVLALNGQTVLSALRWRLTARRLGQSITVGRAIREYYLSQIVNQSLPGGVVGDAGRAVRARHEAGLKRAGQAVVFERLAGQLALFGVTGAAVLLVWLGPGGIVLPDWVLRLVAMTAGVVIVAALVLLAISRSALASGRHVREWSAAFAASVLHPAVIWRQIFLSLATTALNLLAFAICARATGTSLPLTAVAIIVPLILLTMLIPISVSGWGLREGAAAALFPVIGATATEGFAASFAFGLMFLVSVLPGVVFLLIHSRPQSA